jgi:Uma2 family endonuclease
MASDTLTRLVTYDDYRQLPDDGKQYQIIGGELYMTPAPTTIHQRIALRLKLKLFEFVERNKLGEVLDAPVDVILSMTDVVQPDIVFVAKERMNIITQKNIVEAPDLVVEVLSEHTETIDRKKKKELYARHGVREYWIVDPEAKTIDQFLNENGQLTRTHTIKSGETLASQIVEGLQVSVDEIFKES